MKPALERVFVMCGVGRIGEQSRYAMLRDVTGQGCGLGGVRPSMTIRRDDTKYRQWWGSDAPCGEIVDALGWVQSAVGGEVGSALSGLMVTVFQSCTGVEKWLCVSGLRSTIGVESVTVDVDPEYDGDGALCGVAVVLHLCTTAAFAGRWMTVRVGVEHVRQVLVPSNSTDHAAVLAEVIDTALELINRDIASRDRFLIESRGLRTN